VETSYKRNKKWNQAPKKMKVEPSSKKRGTKLHNLKKGKPCLSSFAACRDQAEANVRFIRPGDRPFMTLEWCANLQLHAHNIDTITGHTQRRPCSALHHNNGIQDLTAHDIEFPSPFSFSAAVLDRFMNLTTSQNS